MDSKDISNVLEWAMIKHVMDFLEQKLLQNLQKNI